MAKTVGPFRLLEEFAALELDLALGESVTRGEFVGVARRDC
jgi:hypothetical protein